MMNIVRNIGNMLSPTPTRRPPAYSDETKVAFRQLIGSCMWYENRAKLFTRNSLNNFRTNYGWAADQLATAGLVYESMGDFIHAYIRADITNEYSYLLTTAPRARSDWLLRLRELEGLQTPNLEEEEQPPDEVFHDSRETPDDEELRDRPRNQILEAFQYQGDPTRLVNGQAQITANTDRIQLQLTTPGQQNQHLTAPESPAIRELRQEIAALKERARLSAMESERERYNQFCKSSKTPVLQQNLRWDVSKLDTGFNNLQSSYVDNTILTQAPNQVMTTEGVKDRVKIKSKGSASRKHSKMSSSSNRIMFTISQDSSELELLQV